MFLPNLFMENRYFYSRNFKVYPKALEIIPPKRCTLKDLKIYHFQKG